MKLTVYVNNGAWWRIGRDYAFWPEGRVFKSRQWRAEAVGCLGPTRFLDALKNIFYSSRKIPDDLSYQLANFTKIRSLDAPSRAASCLGNDIFLFIFCHLPTFSFTKTGPLDAPRGGCPPGWMPGAAAPSAPPLHATESRSSHHIETACLYVAARTAGDSRQVLHLEVDCSPSTCKLWHSVNCCGHDCFWKAQWLMLWEALQKRINTIQ